MALSKSATGSKEQRKRAPGKAPAAASAPETPQGMSPAAIIALPGVIGAQLADQVAIMQQVMLDIRSARSITRSQVATLENAMKAANRIAMHSQQISRLAGGRLRQSHERLALHTIVHDVLNGMSTQFKVGGFEVSHRLKPVDVIVDPGLLLSLVQTAVDWASTQGQRLQVRLDIKNWPAHAELALKASAHVAGAGVSTEERIADDLDWQLLLQIAATMGVTVDRTLAADHTMLTIEFPRTVRQLEGLTAADMHEPSQGNSTAFLTEGKPLAGHRVLAVVMDAGIIGELRAVCESMGLIMDTCSNSASAVRFCELDKPHLIIIEERLRDHEFEELRQDLIRTDMNFPVVEVVRAPNVLEMSNWMGDSVSRISRESLRGQLPSFLVMELAKVS
ncbi:hypothetical protein [Caenimonas koreensis]|uniref:hypothetical protein n=1 Tax=Caenimonas koreensis TaxID=367474 RepID=UPI0037852A6E